MPDEFTMRRLSSAWTCYQKKIWPTFALATVGIIPVICLFIPFPEFFPWFVGAMVGFLLTLRWVWRLCFRLVDQVWLVGETTLLVRNHDLVIRIPVADIDEVIYRNSTPEHVELVLREPCLFGSKVIFMPVLVEKKSWRPHPVVRELECLARGLNYNEPQPKYREAIMVKDVPTS